MILKFLIYQLPNDNFLPKKYPTHISMPVIIAQTIPNVNMFHIKPIKVIRAITPQKLEIGLYLCSGTSGFAYPVAKPKKRNKKK